MPAPKTFKPTSKLLGVFSRYHVTLRKKNSTVRHATYGTKTICTPVVFATFETIIKANHLNHLAAKTLNPEPSPNVIFIGSDPILWYSSIADRNGFALLKLDEGLTTADLVKVIERTDEDSGYCSRLIAKIGLYMDLLD